jgi:hypothetical protein
MVTHSSSSNRAKQVPTLLISQATITTGPITIITIRCHFR